MKRIIALCAAALAAVCLPAGAATLGEALNDTNLTWNTGGTAFWTAQSTTTHDGLWAAQSGPISGSQETWIQTTVTGPGRLSFWWKVSSESGYDYLEFYINGVLQDHISGEVNWQVQNYTLSTGTQVLRWRYMKDVSVSAGQDRGWVDQVSFTPPGPPIPALFNTGVDATGAQLALGAPDPHWTIVSGPGISSPVQAVVVNAQHPYGNYTESPFSLWIGVAPNGSGIGTYTLRLTFDLTGLDRTTAVITGQWGIDGGGSIRLNGLDSGIGSGTLSLPEGSFSNFNLFHAFTLKQGFLPGTNTLDFIMTNTGQAAGLNVTLLSGSASLLVPPIAEDPQSVTNLSGTTATFTVNASGTAPLAYQWRKDGVPLADGGNVSGARSNVLTLASVQWTDAGQYTVVVTNTAGSVTSRVASLTVLGVPPQFLTQPQSQTLLLGTNLLSSVTVTGTPPFSFQWRCNGTNLTDGNRISGARTSTLTMTTVQGLDTGFYTAVVSNPWGSVTSAPALLRVLSVERVTLSVSNQSPASFDFTNAAWVEVTLTAPFPNPFIWYTLDGSPPSPSSTQYTGTFIVSNTVVVRAIAINPVDFSSMEMAPAAINVWTAFHLFAKATTGGTVAFAPPGGFYLSNTVVTLTALPEPGWECLNWTEDANGTSSNINVVMDRDKLVTAQFGLIPRYTLAVTTAGGGSVSGNTQSDYLRGTTVNLSAAPAAGWEFLSWSGGASGTSSNVSLVMDRNKSVTAQFSLIPRFTVAVTVTGGGSVSGNTQSDYLRGTTVNLSAEPAPGWEFLSWTGDASSTSSNISLVMDMNKSVTAQFGQFLFKLKVTTVGGGAVSGNTQSNYFRGTTVNLSTTPTPGWYFQSWSGDAGGTSRNVSVVMDRDKSVTSHFAPLTLLAVTAGGGTIVANPASNYVQDSTVEPTAQPQNGWTFLNWMSDASGTNPKTSVTMDRPKEVQAVFGTECKTTVLGQGAVVRNFGTGLVPFGAVVRLTAIPQPGYYLGLWGNAASSQVNPLDFTVTNATPTVSALFAALSANLATLTVLEQGAGVVSSEPQANFYTKGQVVRLTAQPFPGQDFLGWAGDASGNQNPLAVTVTTNQTITANFTRRLGLAVQKWPGPTHPRAFLFLLAGDDGNTSLVQTSPDLTNWQPLTTLTISNTAAQFIDVAVTNHSPRFYRIRVE